MQGVRRQIFGKVILVLLAGIVLMPATAHAQSAIAGVVKDTTGAVMPGVTVEASSPALIERVRSVVTDAEGQYKVIDLRPGKYSLSFTLPGFSTVKREGIELESNFTANVNIELRLGTLEETVTVSGAAPVVDVQSNQQRQVLNRTLLESLPTGDRSFSTNTVPAITRGVDVGGSNQMSHNTMGAYGLTDQQEILIDGMSLLSGRGSPGFYFNIDAAEESVYQVGGGSAEATTGGVTVNMIPRQGGNRFTGNAIAIFSNTDFQGTNYDADLAARGLRQPEHLAKQWDYNASIGGPIRHDKLWFFSSYRNWGVNNFVADSFDLAGNQVKEDNMIFAVTNRLTYQITPKNKFTALYDRMHKSLSNDGIGAGIAPEATRVRTNPLPIALQGKWTSTVSNKLLIESGFSENNFQQWLKYQPNVARATCTTAFNQCAPGTSYGDVAKLDLITGRQWNGVSGSATQGGGEEKLIIPAYRIVSSVSYVTGSHALKTGIQYTWGYQSRRVVRMNGDLVQLYRDGIPDSVRTHNTPIWSDELNSGTRTDLDYDVGLYVQDSWRMRNLTLNPGLRIDLLANSFPEQIVPAGRFTGERNFAAVKDVINWKDVSPRVGAAYDLFGDGLTAIKGSVGKYVQLEQSTTALRYNPLVFSTDTRTWRDTNGDDIAQESEIGPSTNTTFGVRRNVNPDPELVRPYNVLYNIGVQRQLWPGASLSAAYNRRSFRRLFITDNLATTAADYTLINIPDPRGNGQTIPVYNLSVAKRGLVDELDTNSASNKRVYNGVDVSFTSRFGRGGTVTAGSSTGRLISNNCEVDDPNNLRFCDQTQLDIPFLTIFKVVGNYPMPYGIRLAGVFQTIPGAERPINYAVGRAQIPNLTLATVTVRLDEPGERYYDRVNQLDLSIGREFVLGKARLTPKLNFYNMLNVNPVLIEVNTFGSSLGRPNNVLPARVVHFNMLVKF
jgi:carboxypeptidase family protein